MSNIVDTDVVISYLRGRPDLSKNLFNTKVSAITYAELLYGEVKYVDRKNAIDNIKGFLDDFNIEVLPINEEVVELFTAVKVHLEEKGTKLADFDLLIAATALFEDSPLVTNNTKHFSRIPGLKLKTVK